MPPLDWISLIALGAIAGALGQSARIVVGLKKLQDEAAGKGKSFSEAMETSRIFVSLLIGATAGALACVGAAAADGLDPESLSKMEAKQILAFAGAGYAGADFIEGFMNKYKPASSAPAAVPADEHVG